jgi:hypothetical protein
VIVLLARGLTRLLAFVVLPLLGLVALAFAVAAVAGERTARDLAGSTSLTSAWREVGTFLDRTAPGGDTAALLGGIGAVVLGVLIVVATLVPTRERDLPLAEGDRTLGIRRRALRAALASRVGRVRGVTGVHVRLRPRRRRPGGTVRVRATRTPRGDRAAIRATVDERLAPVAGPFALRTKVEAPVGRSRRARTE